MERDTKILHGMCSCGIFTMWLCTNMDELEMKDAGHSALAFPAWAWRVARSAN